MAGAFTAESEYRLWGMWVAREHRREGVGAALLDAVLVWAAAARPRWEIELDVNPGQEAAIRLYARRGSEFTGETAPLGHHEPALTRVMRRTAGSAMKTRDGPSGRGPDGHHSERDGTGIAPKPAHAP